MGNDSKTRLVERLTAVLRDERDREALSGLIAALDSRYALLSKIHREPGVENIVKQMLERLAASFESLGSVRGKRILDIPCGSNSSKLPAPVQIWTPLGTLRLGPWRKGYTALFEPWFCRILLAMGAEPVGVDFGDLDGEDFEHYKVDLGAQGALDFLPDASFDGVQDSRLFGSPEFTAQFPRKSDRLAVAREIVRQEKRLLKPGGIVIHSDAEGWVNWAR
jgi:SAM-dependent methyltransferase